MTRRGKRKLSETQIEQSTVADGPSNGDLPSSEPAAKRTKTRREVFVRGLPVNATDEALITHFSESFPIKRGFIVKYPSSEKCKGYGFVTFADADDAASAVTQFQNSTLGGRKIKLEVAEPRHRDVDDTLPSEVAAASGKNRSVPGPQAIAAKEKRLAELDARKEEKRAPRLIVRNLPWSVKTEADLERLFLSYGKVKLAILPKTGPGLLRGFGIVLLRGRKNAENALKGMNGKVIDERPIAVDFAVDKDTWATRTKAADEAKEMAKNGGSDVDGDVDDPIGGSETSEQMEHGSDVEGSLEDEDDADDANVGSGSEDDVEEDEPKEKQEETQPNTLFIRNLPYSTTDERLRDHFVTFGPLRYARVVLEQDTERPRGTGFVCFKKEDDAKACLKNAPRIVNGQATQSGSNAVPVGQSLLQDENADPLGKYTLEGRVLQLARAVGKSQATKLANAGEAAEEQRKKDKRHLYLLNEGTISTQSKMYESLPASERAMREDSSKQRRSLIQNNPSLHVSMTRLSIRNIPRTVTSRMLKELAREAVVGFAIDAKKGKREKLSKEENTRGGDAMFQAEKDRKRKKSGIVKQAKIVFETVQGSKTEEKEGGGRSRGYGFIEYFTHRCALMGLRWLNGHAIDQKANDSGKAKKITRDDLQDRKRRLIVEFAIENAQVVHRRADRESRAREQTKNERNDSVGATKSDKSVKTSDPDSPPQPKDTAGPDQDSEKLKKRQQIIARKRAKKRSRTGLR